MPELPEVETVRKTLEPWLVNRKIIDVRIFLNKVIKEPDIDTFKNEIINQTFQAVKRKAKLLIFEFDNDVLLSHLRMEGKYYYQKKDDAIDWKHVLLVLDLDNGYQLRYHDTRRFGTFHFQPKDQYQNLKPSINIGPEPWDKLVTVAYLKSKWKNRSTSIKTALLDQTVISGIGNIYDNEILFASKINPLIPVKQLTDQQLQTIIDHSIKILKLAVKMKGTTVATYTSSLGVQGTFQKYLQVHGREKQPCLVCHTPIKKIKVNNRGTYFCPVCQR